MDTFKINRDDTLLLVIDVQERLAPAMAAERFGPMLKNLERWGQAAEVLKLPVILTEQYPKGLGPTLGSVRAAFEGVPTYEKVSFSAMGEATVEAAIRDSGKKTVLIAGMETHVCVWQTLRDLLPTHRVHLLSDAVASRTDENYRLGVDLARAAGAVISGTEVALFDMMQAAGGETFKAISRIVR